MQLFPTLPASWRDDFLAAKWERVRERRRIATVSLETMRQQGVIGSSLQAAVTLCFEEDQDTLLSEELWAEVLIVSTVRLARSQIGDLASARVAAGPKCVRCWRVLEEVGQQPKHPGLCARCADAVESGLVCRPAA